MRVRPSPSYLVAVAVARAENAEQGRVLEFDPFDPRHDVVLDRMRIAWALRALLRREPVEHLKRSRRRRGGEEGEEEKTRRR